MNKDSPFNTDPVEYLDLLFKELPIEATIQNIQNKKELEKDQKQILLYLLDKAWATRDLELELYWKRALYFWGLLTTISAGFLFSLKNDLPLWITLNLSAIGLCLSIVWLFVNIGSKFWQENWQAHIDFLEDYTIGRLYKTVLTQRNDMKGFLSTKPHSVGKLHESSCVIIVISWLGIMLIHLLNFDSLSAGSLTVIKKSGPLLELMQYSFLLILIPGFFSIKRCLKNFTGWKKVNTTGKYFAILRTIDNNRKKV